MNKAGMVQSVIFFVSVAVAAIGWWSFREKMGTRFSHNDKEAVNYTGTATEDDARKLAVVLQEEGFFDGTAEKDVLLNRSDKGTVISFVVKDGVWDDASYVRLFEGIGESAAGALGGLPLSLKLTDEKLNDKHEIVIKSPRTRYKASDMETIFLRGKATPEQGQALAEALKAAGYFTGTAVGQVILDVADSGITAGFIVQDDKWNDEAVVQFFQSLGENLKTVLGNSPLKLELLDSTMQVQKVVEIP
jgi:hypothetical protein